MLEKLFINNIDFLKIKILLEKLLILFIIIFSLFVSFDSDINKLILKGMFSLWLVTLNFKKTIYFSKNNKLFLFIIIFALWLLVTCIFTLNLSYPYEGFIKYFVLPILIISTTIKKEHLKYIVSAFLVGMFINELISYGIYFEIIQYQFFGFDIVGNKNNPVPFMPSHMEYTLFLSLSIIISIYSLFEVKNKYLKFLLMFFTITMIINLFLTTGRTGQFTLLGTLLILTIIYFRHNYKYIIFSFLAIIFIFSMGFLFSDNVNNRLKQGYFDIAKVIKYKDYNTSFGIRLSSYTIIPEIIKNDDFNILYGIGYSRTDEVIQKIQVQEIGEFMQQQIGHLHNSYITIFAGTGFVGLLIIMIVWYYIFSVKIEDKYFNYIRYAFLFVFFLAGFTENMFRQKEVMMLSAIFISIIIILSTKYFTKKEELCQFN
ncbi:O-antigen ligase family protein [Aliarcobacter cryaerophilus]|uniref:O-antigen ligase family protein n=1 Tax=Aliarcobacter cryaerophilus TaxID=28198 RepID=UPI00316DD091